MKKYLESMFLAVLAIVCVTTFASCGGDDDDIPGAESSNMTIGTHRIDVEFEGNTKHWTVNVCLSAVNASGKDASLYEDGKELNNGNGGWMDQKFRSYSIYTDDHCQTLCCLVDCNTETHLNKLEPLTVKLKGYVNGKLKKEKTVVFEDNDKVKLICFFSETSEGDYVLQ